MPDRSFCIETDDENDNEGDTVSKYYDFFYLETKKCVQYFSCSLYIMLACFQALL